MDFFGRVLEVGDYVLLVAKGYRDLAVGKVTGVTPMKVHIEYDWRNRPAHITQRHEQVVKLSDSDLSDYAIKKISQN